MIYTDNIVEEASNPATNPGTLVSHSRSGRKEVRVAVAKNPSSPPEAIKKVLCSGTDEVAAVAQREELSDELRDLIAQEPLDIKNDDLEPHVSNQVAIARAAQVEMAKRPDLSEHHADELARIANNDVREALRGNLNLPDSSRVLMG